MEQLDESMRDNADNARSANLLAQRSAEATKQIKTLIGRSVDQLDQGTGLVGEAGKTIGVNVQPIRRVTEIVAGIGTAIAQQNSGVQEVGNTVRVVDQATQQNAATVEERAAATARPASSHRARCRTTRRRRSAHAGLAGLHFVHHQQQLDHHRHGVGRDGTVNRFDVIETRLRKSGWDRCEQPVPAR